MQRETNNLDKEMNRIIKIYNNKQSKIKMAQLMEAKIINKPQYSGEIKTNWWLIKKTHKMKNLK